MGILWILLIGLVAGIIARFLAPGPNNPSGFILTACLGIAGAFFATWIGQAIGWYKPDQGAGFIGATVGAVVVLFMVPVCRRPGDPGRRRRPALTGAVRRLPSFIAAESGSGRRAAPWSARWPCTSG